MIINSTQCGLLGPFTEAEVLEDRLVCDGTDLCFTVIGDYTVIETNPPGPVVNYSWNGSNYVRLPLTNTEKNIMRANLMSIIDGLEQKSLMNRVIRETFLLDCVERLGPIRAERMALELGRPVSVEEALLTSVGFVKVNILNEQIIALRNQMEAI